MHASRRTARSLATRLIYIVFRWYLAFAVAVTFVQLGLEYRTLSNTIAGDLVSLGRSFGPSVREALWLFDRPLLDTMAKGIAQTAFISGVKIENRSGEMMATAGRVPGAGDQPGTGLLASYQQRVVPLEQVTSKGERKYLGRLILYSDRDVVLERVKYSFLVILFNSILKTTGLWLIFYWVVRRLLSRPLRTMADTVEHINFDDKQSAPVPLQYGHSDELGVLVDALNEMRTRLFVSRKELDEIHRKLEQTVAERTEALNETLDFNRTLIGASPLGFLAYRNDGQCILANRAACEIVGGSEEQLLQQDFRHIESWRINDILPLAKATLSTKRTNHGQSLITTSFGKQLWVDWTFSAFTVRGQPHLLAMLRDITETRATSEAMRQAKELAEQAQERAQAASRSKSEFLANMSHEIRTPINAIAGFTTLAMRTELTPKQADYLEKIHTATQGLSRIINDLLDFSKIEAGRLEMENIAFGIDEVLDTMHAYVGPLAKQKGLPLLINVDPAVPPRLLGDPLRLGQILVNLCSNAVKFTEHGKVEVRVTLELGGTERARLLFAVHDTGIGLTAEQSEKLFQAFSQADASTTRKFGGTGLGLVISQRLVGMMNGRIWLESEKGAGSTFFFTAELGITSPHTAAAPQRESEQMPLSLHAGRLPDVRLLLVEDNPVNQQLLRELLEQEDAQVEIADNGRIALEILQSHGPEYFDIALLDLQMPEMDGYEAAQRIQQLPSGDRLPLLALTAHAMPQERERCLAVGMKDHLTKPIDPDLLVSKIVHWIAPDRIKRQVPVRSIAVSADAKLPGKLPGIDIPSGLDRCKGNARLFRDLLIRFRDHHADAATRLSALCADAQFGDARHLVHAIKGAAANLSMHELADAAAALEQMLLQNKAAPPQLEQALTRFTAALDTVAGSLAPLAHEPEPAAGRTGNMDDSALVQRLQPLLQDLRVCLQYSDTRAEELVTEIQSIAAGQSPLWLDKVAQAVRALEYDAALALMPQQS